jgi:omega-amidase
MSLTVTLIQTTLHWEDRAANLAMLEEKIRRRDASSQLVVLPEMFSTGFSMQPERFAETMDGEAVQWMRRVARQERIILTGSLMIQEEDRYFNRLLWVLPNGQTGHYDKRHLFAYAGEDKHYTPGNRRLHRIGQRMAHPAAGLLRPALPRVEPPAVHRRRLRIRCIALRGQLART